MTESSLVAVKTLLNALSLIIPDMTPSISELVYPRAPKYQANLRSYPNSKKPIVATAETVKDNGLPDMPAKEGAMVTVNQVESNEGYARLRLVT